MELMFRRAVFDHDVLALDEACFLQALTEGGHEVHSVSERGVPQEPDHRHLRLQRARRTRPRRRRAAECSQQFPSSDGDCHTPLPREVRKGNDSTPRAYSLAVRGGQDAGCFRLSRRLQLHYSRRQLFANAAIAASRVPCPLRSDCSARRTNDSNTLCNDSRTAGAVALIAPTLKLLRV